MSNDEKNKIYDFLRENKSKFIYAKTKDNRDKKLLDFLNINHINLDISEITMESVFDYLTSHWDKKCANNDCNNNRK